MPRSLSPGFLLRIQLPETLLTLFLPYNNLEMEGEEVKKP